MKRVLLTAVAVLLAAVGAQAQIPAEVTEVMNRCRAVMHHPDGVEYEMLMKTTIGPAAVGTIHFASANKGEKIKSKITTVMNDELVVLESGFDGTQAWEISHSSKGDTIRITNTTQQKKKSKLLELDMDKKYKKAKIKVKDDCYEIDFSNPVDKKSEAKNTTLKVAKKSFIFREMETKVKTAKLSVTLTKLKVGVKDDSFALDLDKYPGAVVIRE
ncbi:MAG: hypothetical protein IKP83_01830 [Bacteroidales bacterium]|nr:hypothetical protein [Bacteroidales bacterium]